MKTYSVTGEVTISVYTTVLARSAQEAAAIAGMRGVMSLCHQCATGEPKREWVTSGELDGEIVGIRTEQESTE